MQSGIERKKDELRRVIEHPRFIPVCLALGILLRLLWILLVTAPQVFDFEWYYERAVGLVNGEGYSVQGIPTAYWPVGYPGLLGLLFTLFGSSVFLGKVANIVLSFGIMILAYLLSKKIFDSEIAARLTMLVLAFYPNQIAYNSILSSEIPFTFLLLLGASLFLSGRDRFTWLVLSGLVWGVATLMKPQGLFIPAIFLLCRATNPKAMLRCGLVIYAMVFAILTPWLIRNYLVIGTPVMTTNGGIDFFDGNNPYATGRMSYDYDARVRALLGDLGTRDIFDGREVQRQALATKTAIDYIVHDPVKVVLLWPRKVLYLYRSDVDGFYYSLGMEHLSPRMDKVYLALRVVAELYYCSMLVMFLTCLPELFRSADRTKMLALFIVGYFTLICLAIFGNARYHFPFMPWVAIYAGWGAARIMGWNRQRSFGIAPRVATL